MHVPPDVNWKKAGHAETPVGTVAMQTAVGTPFSVQMLGYSPAPQVNEVNTGALEQASLEGGAGLGNGDGGEGDDGGLGGGDGGRGRGGRDGGGLGGGDGGGGKGGGPGLCTHTAL